MTEEAITAKFEDAAWYSESPFPDVDGPSKLAMAEKVHSLGIKVVVTGMKTRWRSISTNSQSLGEGSDEHFAGYNTYKPDLMREPDHSWPPSMIDERKREQVWQKLVQKDDDMLSWMAQGEINGDATERMLNSTRQASRIRAFNFLEYAPWTDAYATREIETVIAESYDGKVRRSIAEKWHPLHTSEYVWTKTAFPTILLRYVGDNIDMVHHVESRTPFLDHHVTEYANGIPPSLKMKYDPEKHVYQEKHILRQAMKPFITEEVFSRKKQPFLGPTLYQDGGSFHKMLLRVVTKENVEALGFVDWEASRDIVDKAFKERDGIAMRKAMAIVQFVTIGQRFGVEKAEPERNANGYVNGKVNGHRK